MDNNNSSNNDRLDIWFKAQSSDLLPQTMEADYHNRYDRITDYLIKNIHTDVERQAIMAHIKEKQVEYNELIYLNNHGPGHVDQVIERASKLLSKNNIILTPYEAYLLLLSIHFHDVGNIWGRENHEAKCRDIMNKLGNLVGDDTPEKRTILRIAASHSGNIHGDRDKIGRLEQTPNLLGLPIRKQLLAAILRFSDELADDRLRANRFFLEGGLIPKYSELYHAYSSSLHSVVIERREVKLTYEFDRTTALRTYRKGPATVYLLDEILERTMKMHIERCYCMRFIRRDTDSCIERILVTINICNTFDEDSVINDPDKITYCMEDKGYPSTPADGIRELCPELVNVSGQAIHDKLVKGVKQGVKQ